MAGAGAAAAAAMGTATARAQQGSQPSAAPAGQVASIRVPAEFAAATAAAPVTFDFPMTGAQVFARACKEEGNHDYAVKMALSFINEIFVTLQERHSEYLVEHFGLSPE